MSIEIKIPELGENISGGRVVSILAETGSAVKMEQPLLELETDKAVIELPSPAAGTIKEIKTSSGSDVKTGDVVFILEEADELPAPAEASPAEMVTEDLPAVDEVKPVPANIEPEPEVKEIVTESKPAARTDSAPVPAAPSVRRFAREIGVDIYAVPGSGPSGRISIDDVKQWSKKLHKQQAGGVGALSGIPAESLPDFSKWGEIDRQSLSRLRETSAKHLSYAWAVIPHVTQFDKADITELERIRKKYAHLAEKAGGKLTVTAILIKVIEKALKKFPQFNASIDMQNNEIIYKKYINVGVAVDTEHGLLVPSLKNVDQKNIIELAAELAEVSQKARDRKLTMDDLQGGNFSISNLGGIGGTGFTPVVNSPEAAILGVSRAEMQPVYQDGNFVPRLMMPLSLSYDHRIIDGAAAARFLRWVCLALEEPLLLALEG